MKELIISAALSGAWPGKADNPAVPITKEEIAEDVIKCARAGAAVVHLHVRDEHGNGTMDTDIFCETVSCVRERMEQEDVDVILNLTTSGAVEMSQEQRFAHLEALHPEICSYDVGTLNWMHSTVFMNSPAFLEKLGKFTQAHHIKPEVEIFDGGMIENAIYYIKKGILKEPVNFQIVLGAAGGLSGTVENLMFLHSMLPPNCTFSASGIGRAHMPIMLAALALGADGIRVGLEDNVLMEKGVPATNEALVQRAVQIATLAGRKIATPQRARQLLSIEGDNKK